MQTLYKPHPQLLTASEAAAELRLSSGTINNWFAQGKLERTKVGGKTYIKREEINRILSKGEQR